MVKSEDDLCRWNLSLGKKKFKKISVFKNVFIWYALRELILLLQQFRQNSHPDYAMVNSA